MTFRQKPKYIAFSISLMFLFVWVGVPQSESATVGLWLFDDGKGDVAKDSSGNGHDGDITGAEWVDGKFGKALEFSENGHVVKIPHDEVFSLETYTMEAWVKVPEITGDWQGIVTKDAWPQRNYGIWIINDRPQVHHSFNTGVNNITVDTKTVIADGAWHHLAATYDRNVQRTYVDGELDAERASKEKPGINVLEISIGQGNNVQQLFGLIDEVRISDAAISEADVKRSVLGLSGAAVDAKGKLATSWGAIKTIYSSNF